MTSLAKREPIEWAPFLSATALLSASVASAALAIGVGIWVADAESFLTRNDAIGAVRRKLLLVMLVGGTAPAVLALGAAVLGRGRAARALERIAHFAAPLALVWAIEILVAYKVWYSRPLEFLVLLSVTVLAFERALRASLASIPTYVFEGIGERYDALPGVIRRVLPWVIVIMGASWYAAFTGYWSVIQHHRLGTASYDLGIYDNLMYNALEGHPFRSTVLYGSVGGNYIAGHAEFAMLALLPIYALFPRAETLLIFQSVIIGFAAVPLYAFAKTQIPRWSAALVSLAYLLFAPLHGPNFYDFHWLPVSVFFVFCLFWAVATRRDVLAWFFFVFLVLIREDVPIGLTLFGVFLVVAGRRVLMGSSMAALAVVSFVIIKFVIMPACGSWWFENLYKKLIPAGASGYAPIVQTILINPGYFFSTLLEKDKLVYALHLFAPIAFLPARRAALLLGASGGFFFTLMTTEYSPTLNISFQYGCHWIPYLFGASVLALRWLGQDETLGIVKRRAALGALCVGVVLHSLVFGCILQQSHFTGGFAIIPFKFTDDERARYRDLRQITALIPENASVAATDTETPHISNRLTAYTLNLEAGEPEYVLIRKAALGIGDSRGKFQAALNKNPYGFLAEAGDFRLFKRGHSSTKTAPKLAELGLRPKS